MSSKSGSQRIRAPPELAFFAAFAIASPTDDATIADSSELFLGRRWLPDFGVPLHSPTPSQKGAQAQLNGQRIVDGFQRLAQRLAERLAAWLVGYVPANGHAEHIVRMKT